MKHFTQDELDQRYSSYFPYKVKGVKDVLKLAGIKENELKKLKKETYTKLSEIDSEIKNSPEKEKRARSDIDKRTEKRLIMISGKQTKLKDEMNDALFAVEDALRNEDLILKINGIEEKMLSFFSEKFNFGSF